MVTQVFTITDFQRYAFNLPKNMIKYVEQINQEIAKSGQRRIRLRAPSGSTGSLKRMSLRQVNKNQVDLTGPRHAGYVNDGVAPDKRIPVELFEMHQTNPGSTAGKRFNIPNPKAWVMASYHGGKGFIDNGLESLRKDIPKVVERGMLKALSK